MSFKDVLAWLFARKTKSGSRYLYGPDQERLRKRLEGRWSSKYHEEDGKIHLLIDPDGNPTKTYPHVHVIHDERANQVHFVASTGERRRVYSSTLSGDVSGNEVNAEIDKALAELRRHL